MPQILFMSFMGQIPIHIDFDATSFGAATRFTDTKIVMLLKNFVCRRSYWHGNPLMYKAHETNHTVGKSFGELYQATIDRENKIKQMGYNLQVMWESNWKSLIKIVKKIQKKFRSNRLQRKIN